MKIVIPERPPTGAADEAAGVVKVAHGLAGLPRPPHLLPTRVAHAYRE